MENIPLPSDINLSDYIEDDSMKIRESFKSYIHINSDEFYAELVWDYEENRKIERIYKKCETK